MAYFRPIQDRNNLMVLTNATATQITWGSNTDGAVKASGIQFVSQGQTYSVNATKEVIISAGEYNLIF